MLMFATKARKLFQKNLPHRSVLQANWSEDDCSKFLIYCGMKSIYFHLTLSADIAANLGNSFHKFNCVCSVYINALFT